MDSIPRFYCGKTVLITGSTGFLGKVLLEKLLRSCPGIERIYCLIREKSGKSATERLEKILNDLCFRNLLEHDLSVKDKVKAVKGNLLDVGLGLDVEMVETLEKSVNIVFHSAGTVKFDETLKHSLELNVQGVRRMIELCRRFKNLESFVHVSSAFTNCELPYVEEQVYPCPTDPDKVLELLDMLDEKSLQLIVPYLIGDKPNVFTYTKHLAEVLLMTEGGDLPVAIVRPSIITASWMEPLPGWIDSVNGTSSLYIAMGKGLLRSMIADYHVVADIVPVDLPSNMMLAVGCYRASVKEMSDHTNAIVCHMTTGDLNPFTWGEMENSVVNYFKKNPLDSCFRRPKANVITSNSFLHDCWILVSHLVPAYAVDAGYILTGQKPRMVKTYNELHKTMEQLEYFTTRQWQWTHGRSDQLKAAMSIEDQKAFIFDPRVLHWPTYVENYCSGTKTFLLKEDPAGLPAARARIKMFRNVRYVFNTTLLVLAWRLLIANSSLARNSWFFVLGLVFKFVRFFRLTSTIQHKQL